LFKADGKQKRHGSHRINIIDAWAASFGLRAFVIYCQLNIGLTFSIGRIFR